MTPNLVAATIRRSNRKLFVLSLLGVLAVLITGVLSWRYYYNFFLGPFPIDRAALIELSDPGAQLQYFVTVTGDDVIDTGIEMVSRNRRTGSERVTANYMALLIDDRALLVEAPSDAPLTTFTGSLARISSGVRANVIDDITGMRPSLRDAFLPFMLEARSFRTIGYFGLVVGIPLLAVSLLGFARAARRNSDPLTHPIMRTLGHFGPAQHVASQIEGELQSPHQQLGQLHLTRNWVVFAAPNDLSATRIDDVVWVYKQMIQQRVNGAASGKTFVALVCDRHGNSIRITGKNEPAVDEMLHAVLDRAPWALAGHSQELEKAWRSNRASIVAAVDQRRQQFGQMLGGAPA